MHTPGPWTVTQSAGFRTGKASGTYTINGACGTVATLPNPNIAANPDNARLIANAPALLASLRQILADLEDSDFTEDFADTIQAARAAIEAATGDDLSELPPGALECRVTSDGYRLYRIASGEWVDDVRPEWRDLTFDAFPDEVSDEARSFGPWGQR